MSDDGYESTTTQVAVLETAPGPVSNAQVKVRRLGGYVGLIGIAQVLLYVAAWHADFREVALYFDPRLGLRAFAELVSLPEGLVRWGSAFLLLNAGWGLIVTAGVRSLRHYVLLEIVLGGPSLLFILLVLRAGLSASYGFSTAELLAPLPVYVLASGVPFVWACYLWGRQW